MFFFDNQQVFFTMWGYPMSYLEFFGTIAGGIAVWLSARGNVWSWPIGIVNVTLFFFLFFQLQLYPDMFLQVFFFVTNLLGWWRWTHPAETEEDQKRELRISYMPRRQLVAMTAIGGAATFLFGAMASRLHEWLPRVFSQPSAFPYADSFVAVMSIVATYMMVQKKVECWAMWIIVDAVATVLYCMKDIWFVGVEYFLFCFIAGMGLWGWVRAHQKYTAVSR